MSGFDMLPDFGKGSWNRIEDMKSYFDNHDGIDWRKTCSNDGCKIKVEKEESAKGIKRCTYCINGRPNISRPGSVTKLKTEA